MIARLLIFIGKPVYLLITLPFVVSKLVIKVLYSQHHRLKVSLPPLKQFLKKVYPLVISANNVFSFFRSPVIKYFKWSITLFIVVTISGLIGLYLTVFKDLPDPNSLETKPFPLTTHIKDRNGNELFKFYKSENRTLVKLKDLPQDLINATISIEDANFYNHKGFSIRGILRAFVSNLNCQLLTDDCQLNIQGGSTITQQLVKTTLLTPEKTYRRKLRELVLSIWVENIYTKDQILEMYLNRVGYGGSLYGVEESSLAYFGISATKLNLAQSSFLAGLPASPSIYSPYGSHPEFAKARQAEVLSSMVKNGHITWEQADQESSSELKILPPQNSILAPHFVMYVRQLLTEKYGPELVDQGGLNVITSLDLDLQNQAQKAVSEETAKVAYLKVGNGAALVTNPKTGEILSMVGSRDYFDIAKDGNVNVTLMPRQPGSSIKPLNYALALQGGKFTPASIIEDSPITYRIPGQPPYSPVNYDRRYHGRITLRSALANSYNIPAVKLLATNGINNFIDLAEKMGISTWSDRKRFGLSLTLGGGEVTMVDMATAYGVFANSGSKVPLTPILKVTDSKGHVLEEFRCGQDSSSSQTSPKSGAGGFTEITTCPQDLVLNSRVSYLISDILSDNAARTPVFGPRSDLFIPNQAIAVKTGTTNDLRDNWTIGYTTDRVIVVWVGNNDNSPMSYVASGITGASPIWRRIANTILSTNPHPTFSPPSDLLKLEICTITGELACGPICPTKTEYFIPGTQPQRSCNPEFIERLRKATPTPTSSPQLQ